ncbi:hypothetical protein CUZ56_01134 [Saezia sanguinis]|uniref:DUF4375 domain-containing protein n=1 Tax=Saezia sanguinis TaxID=1965230 RepID=A0A433SEN0_9BURK|nr:hypothetical protein [Saezia sanguinis]RUS67193.1 hypothetical protein CUZ56_01134 [Saezia sanguinis]
MQMDIAQEVKEKLELLQYTPQWLIWGFMDASLLEAQWQAFEQDGRNSPEHYRYTAFRRWLQNRQTYTDAEIKQFLELVESDPDQFMALAAGVDLLRQPGIQAQQFDAIASFLDQLSDGSLAPAILREQYLHELRQLETLSLAEFQRYMHSEHSVVQEYLLENFAQQNGMFLKMLEQDGKTKAIRNRAKQLGKRRSGKRV